jgi:hypothetical protein
MITPSKAQNPLREIFKELKPLLESPSRNRRWEHSRRDKLLMRASLYSCPAGVAFAFAGAYWHVGWADYIAQASIAVCWLSGLIMMVSGMAGGIRAIKQVPLTILNEIAESSDLEYEIISKLQDKDDFLLACAEEKLKSRSQEVVGRNNLVPSFLDKYKVLLPILAIALASAGILQTLLNAAFGVDLAQVVAMLFIGFFIGQFFSHSHVATLNRAIFVLQQAREAKKASHRFQTPSLDAKVSASLPDSARAVEPISTSLN